MTSVLKGIFGDTKRISILEELVENWGEFLTIDEIARISNTSPKTAYRHINELNHIGILEQSGLKPKQFKLKEDDKRAVALSILESEEYLRKMEISLEKAEKEEKINNRESFVDFYQMDGTDFDSPEKISYTFIGVDVK